MKAKRVVVVGYESEHDRKMRRNRKASITVETSDELEDEERRLNEDLWIAYETTEGGVLASIKNARTFLGGH